jgi:protein-tyrosine kinase
MSIIEESIARAKHAREDHARRDAIPKASVARPTIKARPDDTGLPPPVELAFPRLELDRGVCIANRIVIGLDSESYAQVSDAYRMIRTRLLHLVAREGWSSFAVTSAGPDDGKSVTLLNLGLILAQERRRNVFLLDLDLRNPSMFDYLGVKPRMGLGSYLEGRSGPEDLFSLVGSDNLILAGDDARYDNSTELLGRDRLRELLAHIRGLDPNALILADLPPVLSVADAAVVAPTVSAVLLVASQGKTRRDALARAVEALSNATIGGIILNKSSEVVQNYYG